ncbi:hypothetical protein GCM10023086_28970 [Streptomyces venetus]|uniref:Cellulase n=1 Tax=Streptomyces venetus TaxID=1701086 RepID=A0ABP8FS31_9ACTN
MDDFERDLSRLMRDTQQHTPYEPEHRQRLHAGIRTRRRSRLLWKAGGSAVAVAGLSVGLALLPSMLTRAQPADHDRRPPPATSPTPLHEDEPTTNPPSSSGSSTQPASSAPATATVGNTPTGATGTSPGPTPTSTVPEPPATSEFPTQTPSPSLTTALPSRLETEEPSASAGAE